MSLQCRVTVVCHLCAVVMVTMCHVCTQMATHTHTHVYAHVHVHTHTHTHTHTTGHSKLEPKSFVDTSIVEEYADDYLFMGCIQYINSVSTWNVNIAIPLSDVQPCLRNCETIVTGLDRGWNLLRMLSCFSTNSNCFM